MRIFEGALTALRELTQEARFEGVKVGYASRTYHGEWAAECLRLLEVPGCGTLEEVVHYKEIYPGDKQAHFSSFREEAGIACEEMLFFDNERHNCVSVSRLGVTCVHTPDGMTTAAWRQGLREFHEAAVNRRS
jgi:magnesium-dependent phosphatase 1